MIQLICKYIDRFLFHHSFHPYDQTLVKQFSYNIWGGLPYTKQLLKEVLCLSSNLSVVQHNRMSQIGGNSSQGKTYIGFALESHFQELGLYQSLEMGSCLHMDNMKCTPYTFSTCICNNICAQLHMYIYIFADLHWLQIKKCNLA